MLAPWHGDSHGVVASQTFVQRINICNHEILGLLNMHGIMALLCFYYMLGVKVIEISHSVTSQYIFLSMAVYKSFFGEGVEEGLKKPQHL